jgi:Domain of unknown function (DUF4288)
MDIETEGQNLSFYIAVFVYESSSDAPNYQKLYEEDYVLVKAFSDEDAKQKASLLSQKRQETYKNEMGESITWTLKHILDVSPILSENFEHGAEIYTRFFRNYEAYVAFEPILSGGLQ